MSQKNNRLIFVTNDDGYSAYGFRALIDIAKDYGYVIAVAPFKGQSGMSHAITVNVPLRLYKIEEADTHVIYACTGTPVDCVKLAINRILPRRPDLLLSGVNHGSNSSASVIYSGTLAAAREGSINRIPSVGFSFLDYSLSPDFSAVRNIAGKIIRQVFDKAMPDWFCLNVNIPNAKESEIKGIKLCRQTKGFWKEEFEKRTDPHGMDYYWLTGTFENLEPDAEDSDEWALRNNFVSVVPVTFDCTAFDAFSILSDWKL